MIQKLLIVAKDATQLVSSLVCKRGWLSMIVGTTAMVSLNTNSFAADVPIIVCGNELHAGYKWGKELFEKENPDLKIQYEVVPWGQCQSKVFNLAGAGSPPAAAYVGSRALRQLADSDLIVPAAFSAAERGEYWPNVLKTVSYQGKQWGYPRAFSSKAIYYRKDLFAKAGYKTFPKTWDEFLDATQKIKAMTDIPGYGMIAKSFDQTFHQFLNWLYTNNGEVINDQGEVVFDSTNTRETMEFYAKLADVSQDGPAAHDRDTLRNLFNDGKLASFISGPWDRNRLNKDLDWGVTDIPHGPSGSNGTLLITDSLVVFKGTGMEKEATKFIKFLTNATNQFRFEKEVGYTPLRPVEGVKKLTEENAAWKPFLAGISRGGPEPLFTDFRGAQETFIQNIQQLVMKELTSDEAVENIQADLEDLN